MQQQEILVYLKFHNKSFWQILCSQDQLLLVICNMLAHRLLEQTISAANLIAKQWYVKTFYYK